MSVHRIFEFDTWRPSYNGATVTVYKATAVKASLFTDEALTIPAANPQILLSQTLNGIGYGKFLLPLYTADAYFLDISGQLQTGIERVPLTTLAAIDASLSVATASGGTVSRQVQTHLGQMIFAEDHGAIGTSAATNNATLVAAIGAAAAKGGGEVIVPSGAIPLTGFTLPQGVVIEGQGEDVTTLQCETAGVVVSLGGDRAGFRTLTLDGISLQAGSVGVYSKANDDTIMDRVKIKRFETNLHCRGGRRANWKNLSLDNAVTGAKLHGDNDAGGGANGDQWLDNRWEGGLVTNCTGIGVELSYEDKRCWHNRIAVGFENNTGTALKVNGARDTDLSGSWMSGNTTDFLFQDDSDPTKVSENTLIGLYWNGGSISGGSGSFNDTCQDVILRGLELSGATFTLNSNIKNNVLALDCNEDSAFVLAGKGIRWTRARTILADDPGSFGITADAVATTAWSHSLNPGQVGIVRARVTANGINNADYAIYHIAQGVVRLGSDLNWKAQTVNFTLGDTITGATSGCSGVMQSQTDAGATGVMALRDISPGPGGEFVDGEIITGALGGSATTNGTLTSHNAALLGTITSVQTAVETDATWACIFAVSGTSVEVQVTGAAGKSIGWDVHAEVVLS